MSSGTGWDASYVCCLSPKNRLSIKGETGFVNHFFMMGKNYTQVLELRPCLVFVQMEKVPIMPDL